ncbi:MAG: hypothetical protein SNJ77_08915 [Cytophagales bacterium]
MKTVLVSLFIIAFLIFHGGCANNKLESLKPNCDTTNVTFISSIKPVFEAKCYNCHEGRFPSGGINLRDEVYVTANAELIMKTIRYDAGVIGMPIGERLPNCEVQKFEVWVRNGGLLD